MRANVPPSAGVGSGPFNTLLTASSTGAVANGVTAVPDAVWDQVTAVIGSTVDLTNTAAGISCSVSPTTCDLGPGPSTSPTTTNSTAAGTGTTFTLYVKNNDTLSNSYTFSPSSSSAFPGSLPTGWTVKFVAAGGTCASTAITTLGPIAAGAQSSVVACVTPPITATIGTQNIDFQVVSSSNSSTGGIVNDIIMDAVTVTQQIISSDTLTPSNNGQIGPGGTSVYPHTLTNTGNQSCGAFTIAANLSAADAAAGWVATVYIDTNKNGVIDSGDTLVTGTVPALAAGASTSLLIKVFAPPGITPGTVSTATITATDTVGACAVQTTTDVSTVITGQVRLMKTQVADPACGGNLGSLGALTTTTFSVRAGTCVIYQVTGTNQGVAPVANVSLSDAIPAYTTYEGATQPSTNCVSTGLSGTAIAFATTGTPVNTVSCGSTSNSLAPGGTVTTTFAVKVNQ